MSVVINGILTRKLPWGLVLLGVFLVIAVELLGIRSLSFAVGSYLSIGTTAAIFCGGLVRWLAERGMKQTEEGEASPGALYASGLIAAGGIVGLLAIGVKLLERQGWIPPRTPSSSGQALPAVARQRRSLGMLAFAAPRLLALLLRPQAARGREVAQKKPRRACPPSGAGKLLGFARFGRPSGPLVGTLRFCAV